MENRKLLSSWDLGSEFRETMSFKAFARLSPPRGRYSGGSISISTTVLGQFFIPLTLPDPYRHCVLVGENIYEVSDPQPPCLSRWQGRVLSCSMVYGVYISPNFQKRPSYSTLRLQNKKKCLVWQKLILGLHVSFFCFVIYGFAVFTGQ